MAQHSRPLPPPRTPGRLHVPPLLDVAERADAPASSSPTDVAAGSTAGPAPEEQARPRDAGAVTGGAPWHRREPWLAIALLGCIPVGIAPLLPTTVRPWLLGVSGAFMVGSILLLVRQERRKDAEKRTRSG